MIAAMNQPHLAPDQRYDWWRILQDLSMHGMTMEGIFAATGIPKSTLAGYKNLDAEPKHADGERLLALWHRKMHPPAPVVNDSVRQTDRVRR